MMHKVNLSACEFDIISVSNANYVINNNILQKFNSTSLLSLNKEDHQRLALIIKVVTSSLIA